MLRVKLLIERAIDVRAMCRLPIVKVSTLCLVMYVCVCVSIQKYIARGESFLIKDPRSGKKRRSARARDLDENLARIRASFI